MSFGPAQGVKTAAEAAAKAGVQRVLLISSLLVTEQHGRHPLRIMLNTLRWRMMDNKVPPPPGYAPERDHRSA